MTLKKIGVANLGGEWQMHWPSYAMGNNVNFASALLLLIVQCNSCPGNKGTVRAGCWMDIKEEAIACVGPSAVCQLLILLLTGEIVYL